MDREVAKRRAEVMLAFANGCDVQFYNGVTKQWEDIAAECVGFDSQTQYRVKPLPKYRPFKSQEECWLEMHKHPDFGWLKNKDTGNYISIGEISKPRNGDPLITWATNEDYCFSISEVFSDYTFTDDTPFGVKEE